MTDLEDRIEVTAERAAAKAIDGLFMRIGVDTSDPLAMQKDFATLRAFRESVELVQRRTLTAAITVTVTGILAIIWAYLTHRV